MKGEESQLGRIDVSSNMVCQSRQRKGNDHPSGASQGAAGLLVEMENSHCWVGSNSPSQRCDPYSGREVVTWLSEHCSGVINPASCRCRWRLAAGCWYWKGSAGQSFLSFCHTGSRLHAQWNNKDLFSYKIFYFTSWKGMNHFVIMPRIKKGEPVYGHANLF